MAWLAVDRSGSEYIHEEKPYRMYNCVWEPAFDCINLPSGSIKKLIGRELTWSDKPVELKEKQLWN